ncbi:MAG: biopolymer transporter ExbD [Myxococcales bacterium]|nr:biopolymer transporter ExbD [Myxococcales bacterium]
MAFQLGEGDDDVIATINVVPFVDIVLVLLIIFMLTSSAIVRASIPVELPTAASGGATVPSTLNLVLTVEGELFLDGRRTDHAALAAHVARAAAGDAELQAVISADTRIDYGRVVTLIDTVKQNGVKTFALNIERQPQAD